MKPKKSQTQGTGVPGSQWRLFSPLACAVMVLAGEAGAAEKTYQYFRFEPKLMQNGSGQIQLSEFTFSFNGALLNINNRDTTGTNVVAATAASGAQDPNATEGPNKTLDGQPLINGGASTKWFSNTALTTPLDITFTAGQVTVDAYNFATANDSATNSRTPVTWFLYGRNSTSDPWEVLDFRGNQAMNYANNTYQAGYTIPEEVPPVVNFFRVQNTPAAGSAAIVRDDDPNGVTLEWDTTLGDVNGTTITPVPGAVAQVGSANVDPPNNGTTLFTISASRALPSPIESTATLRARSVAGGSSNFRYIRFKATKLRTGLATGTIQLEEFGFLNGTTPVLVTDGATNPGGANGGGGTEGPAQVIDGNTTTSKWLDFNNAPLIFDLGEPTLEDDNTFTHYYFYTGNDAPDRDPIRWSLEGSNDQVDWTLIENVAFDYPTGTARLLNSRSIPLPGASLEPLINQFIGDGTTLVQGTPLVLSWDTRAAASVSIDQGVGTVGASGTTSVTPPLGTTIYTITANSAGGTSSTSTFTVNVIEGTPPVTPDYANFDNAGNDFSFTGSASIVNGNLLLTPDVGGQLGTVWYRTKQNVADGFEATFSLSMTHTPNGNNVADGISFTIQNRPEGTAAPSTGENGVISNAVNIGFKTYGGNAAESSRIEVRNGSTVVQTVSASNVPGITYNGVTGLAWTTLTGMPGSEPYRVRIVYVPVMGEEPSHLDVYLNEVAVIENLAVDLEDAGAVDASGNAFLGFSGRTGGFSQRSEITNWQMAYGDFSALPPFGIVKSFRNTIDNTNTWDLVWDSDPLRSYVVQSSANLVDWEDDSSYFGESGQIGVKVAIDFPTNPLRFYRVVEDEEE